MVCVRAKMFSCVVGCQYIMPNVDKYKCKFRDVSTEIET